jgi:CheY-like chemotaxis protein
MKILICEDDFMMAKAIEHRLTRDEHQVTVAPDGRIAAERVKAEDFDLIITDLLMPFFGGLELINLVRNQLGKTIPIIVLSKLGNESTVVEAFKIGATDYITKPFSPNELAIRIKKIQPATAQPELAEPAAPKAQKLIDLAYLRELASGDMSFMNEMVKYFIENAPVLLIEMKASSDRKDWETLREQANKFIHQLSFMGIKSILADVEAMDTILLTGRNTEKLDVMMDKITRVSKDAIAELQTLTG